MKTTEKEQRNREINYLSTNLVSALTNLDVNNFTHFAS